jgi:hypothetical protein
MARGVDGKKGKKARHGAQKVRDHDRVGFFYDLFR